MDFRIVFPLTPWPQRWIATDWSQKQCEVAVRQRPFSPTPGVAGSAGGLARACTHKPIAKC